VINVSWEDAQAYIAWLNTCLEKGSASPPATQARPEAARSKGPYRLPSEAEWEYACRAGTTTPYSTGASISKRQAQFSEGAAGSAKQTAPVGSFPANAFGLHDMHGNVREWVRDCHAEYGPAHLGDSSAYETNDCSNRVNRGGSWDLTAQYLHLRSASRNMNTPSNRSDNLGFRVARTF
jgi:formylglycine-generating enzyme required for sulfatase activity